MIWLPGKGGNDSSFTGPNAICAEPRETIVSVGQKPSAVRGTADQGNSGEFVQPGGIPNQQAGGEGIGFGVHERGQEQRQQRREQPGGHEHRPVFQSQHDA